MKAFTKTFLSSNGWQYRLLRTISQGIIGVLLANVDVIIGSFVIDPSMKGVIVALVMAVLSPVYAALGKADDQAGGDYSAAY